ncbi:tetratricopeptide repeat protein [Lacipirellula limnantheis]|nr:tetratricopeptide repeat protein [Lacipirellula limnantheis]
MSNSSAHDPKRSYSVNWRLAGVTVALACVAVPLAYWRYRSAYEQTAGALLERAAELEKEQEWDDATRYYQRYLLIKPSDGDALARMTDAYAHGEQTPERLMRVNALLYRVLGQSSEAEQPALRLQLAENLLKLGSFKQAIAELKDFKDDALLPRSRKTVALAKIRLVGFDPDVKIGDAVNELLAVADELPDDVELANEGAAALRQFGSDPALADLNPPTRADEIMDRLVELKPDDVDARLARCRYRFQHQLPGGNEDLERAIAIAPNNIEVLYLSAISTLTKAKESAELKPAEEHLRRVIKLAPSDERAYALLADVLAQTGRADQAADLLQKGRKPTGNSIELNLRLVNLQLLASQWDQAAETLRELDAQSPTILAQLEQNQRLPLENRLKLAHARLDLGRQALAAAATKLRSIYLSEEAASVNGQTPAWVQATQLLAAIHGQSGQWDKAAEYSRVLLRARPNDPAVTSAAADALLKSGSPADAVAVLDGISEDAGQGVELPLRRVQAHLAQQLALQKEERNWSEFQSALKAAKPHADASWELLFCEANYLLASGNDGGAAKTVREGEARFASEVRFWKSAAQLYSRLKLGDDLARALQKHQALGPPAAEQVALEAALLAESGDYKAAEKRLASASAEASPAERRRLDRLRVETLMLGGQSAAAKQLISSLIEADPADTGALEMGIQIALSSGDLPTAARWEEKLAAADPNAALLPYWRASRLLLEYQRLNAEEKEEHFEEKEALKKLVASIRLERPRWYPVVSLAAQLAEATEGGERQALADYQLAVDLGDRRAATLEHLATLLYKFERPDDADKYLTLLATDAYSASNVDAAIVEMAVKQDRAAAAIEAAQKRIEKSPQDVSKRLFLARLLLRSGDADQAIEVLQAAAKQFPADDQVWSGLIAALVSANRPEEARSALESLSQSSGIPTKKRLVAAARGHELLGDLAAAQRQYELAIVEEPGDADTLLGLARILAKGSPVAARAQYEKVLQADPLNVEARRALAMLLASTGEEADWTRATQILSELSASEGAGADNRLRALLLSQKGRTRAERIANCQKAREILEQQIAGESTGDAIVTRRLLAQTLEREAALSGDTALIAAAAEQFREIIDESGTTADQIAQAIDFSLRNGSPNSTSGAQVAALSEQQQALLAEAEANIERLRRLHVKDDDGIDALAVSFAARLAIARGDETKARGLIAEFAASLPAGATPAEESSRLLAIGRLYGLVGAHAEAEAWYRKLAAVTPRANMLVIQSLADQGRRSDAANFCLEAAAGPLSTELALMLAAVMTVPEGEKAEEFSGADAALEAAISKQDANLQLLQAAAVMRASRRDYDAAIDIFRRILAINPTDELALNNLATLLAERPNQRAEALELIERAVALSGRQPTLLDTQGTIHLKLGQAPQAIQCLEEATAGGAADARYYLHLAAAYQLAERRQDAQAMLAEAKNFGIEKFVLTDDDRALLEALEKQSAIPSSTSAEKL